MAELRGPEINPDLLALAEEVKKDIRPILEKIESVRRENQLKVLQAFRAEGVDEYHFAGTTGYGYDDAGRETMEAVFARIFGTETALVRPLLASGTHAISSTLFALLNPGDELLSATGKPYDTLETVIGTRGNAVGNLREKGVTYRQLSLTPEGRIDVETLVREISPRTKMVTFQRSRGYAQRPSLSVTELGAAIQAVKKHHPGVICFVDNCYGEFVEAQEPTQVGADIAAGSLIKNPGGGLAPMGGYVVGRSELVERVANHLTAPGLGRGVGATLDLLRPMFQGLYLAPHFVGEALAGMVFSARICQALGYEVDPVWDSPRTDIIQSIQLKTPEKLVAFVQGLQKAMPVGSGVTPVPGQMPGYTDQIIMAAGGFVQGGSLELSADAPLRPPYTVFLQGGLVREQAEWGVIVGLTQVGQVEHKITGTQV